jgi:hypothetical protein
MIISSNLWNVIGDPLKTILIVFKINIQVYYIKQYKNS